VGKMVEAENTRMISRMAIQFSMAFAILGIGLLYLAILISDADVITKVIWASGLSLTVAAVFLIVWAMAMDSVRQQDWEMRQRSGK